MLFANQQMLLGFFRPIGVPMEGTKTLPNDFFRKITVVRPVDAKNSAASSGGKSLWFWQRI